MSFLPNIWSSPPPPLPPLQMQINFEDRKLYDVGNDCLMTIDGTDFRVPQTGEAKTGNWFASHKYAGKSALRYEIGVSIIGGNLVWIQGPYPAGRFNDIAIFNKVLRHFLEPNERVEADNGYVGTTDKIKCPDNPCNPVEMRRCSPAHGIATRQSTDASNHGEYSGRRTTMTSDVRAIAIMTQLAISNGSPMFEVEYAD
jgi:hypothetical protein